MVKSGKKWHKWNSGNNGDENGYFLKNIEEGTMIPLGILIDMGIMLHPILGKWNYG